MTDSDLMELAERWTHPDAPRLDQEDRFAIYAVHRDPHDHEQRRVCETSETGVVYAIKTMVAEGEIKRGEAVGVFDRLTRSWVINPYV